MAWEPTLTQAQAPQGLPGAWTWLAWTQRRGPCLPLQLLVLLVSTRCPLLGRRLRVQVRLQPPPLRLRLLRRAGRAGTTGWRGTSEPSPWCWARRVHCNEACVLWAVRANRRRALGCCWIGLPCAGGVHCPGHGCAAVPNRNREADLERDGKFHHRRYPDPRNCENRLIMHDAPQT